MLVGRLLLVKAVDVLQGGLNSAGFNVDLRVGG
jgi:hypothetical protein